MSFRKARIMIIATRTVRNMTITLEFVILNQWIWLSVWPVEYMSHLTE